jgi:hypothetical protein
LPATLKSNKNRYLVFATNNNNQKNIVLMAFKPCEYDLSINIYDNIWRCNIDLNAFVNLSCLFDCQSEKLPIADSPIISLKFNKLALIFCWRIPCLSFLSLHPSFRLNACPLVAQSDHCLTLKFFLAYGTTWIIYLITDIKNSIAELHPNFILKG